MKTLKFIAAPIAMALLLYGLTTFVAMNPDAREWDVAVRAFLAWVWLMGSIGAVGLIASGEASNGL